MVTCEKVQKTTSCWFITDYLPLWLCINSATGGLVVIGASLGDSIQRGRGRGGGGYMDK